MRGEPERQGRSWVPSSLIRHARYAISALARRLIAFLASTTGVTEGRARNPVPVDKMAAAEIPNHPNIRAVGLAFSPELQADLVQSLRDETEGVYCKDENGEPSYCSLALSGGAGRGAFGAGILNGWTEAGTRPVFKIVTGISTGAIIAPFAFAGSKYDLPLKTGYTTISDDDIYISKGPLALLGAESFYDSTPLAATIGKWIDDDLIKAVAKGHAAGRRLVVGTTNMDKQQFVVWNMGAIACSSDPKAFALFRKVILASASLPGLFSTTLIDVEVDGVKYDEMHGDGGVFAPAFFHTYAVDTKKALETVSAEDDRKRPTRGRLFVIRHDRVDPERKQVERRLMPIVDRAISTMVKSMALADLYFMYITAKEADMEFNYIDIPHDFTWQSKKEFDTAELNRLYQIGYDMAKAGIPWEKGPPYFDHSPLAKML